MSLQFEIKVCNSYHKLYSTIIWYKNEDIIGTNAASSYASTPPLKIIIKSSCDIKL